MRVAFGFFLRTCGIRFGVLYTFFLRFLPPPRNRNTKCRVDSVSQSKETWMIEPHHLYISSTLTLVDVVVAQSAAIFQLLSGEDQTLLIRWDTLLILRGENTKALFTKHKMENPHQALTWIFCFTFCSVNSNQSSNIKRKIHTENEWHTNHDEFRCSQIILSDREETNPNYSNHRTKNSFKQKMCIKQWFIYCHICYVSNGFSKYLAI